MAVDLKTQLFSLLELQQVDSRIYNLSREKEVKPQQIVELDAAFESKKSVLAGLEKTLIDLQKQKKEKEMELGSKEESIVKLQGQLYQLKTNKDYHTMQQQIEGAKADKSVIEDKILEIMEKAESIKSEVETEKKHLTDEERIFSEKKKEVQSQIKEIDEKIASFESRRRQLTPNVPLELLSQYERILKIRNGLALVTVEGTSCGGCHMFVPPQVINMIAMYDRIVTCEMCNRILYLDEQNGKT